MKITALLIFKKTKIQKKCIYLIAMEQKATSQTSSVRIVFMSSLVRGVTFKLSRSKNDNV